MHVRIKRHSERNGAYTIAVYIAGTYQWSDARAVRKLARANSKSNVEYSVATKKIVI
jgi:hypothetical protein